MQEHFIEHSLFDNIPLDVMIYSPTHPIGIVQISHGMCEHKERYIDFMHFLNQHGYVCIIHDHRGHGHSIKNKEDLGYFYKNGDQGMIEDLHQLTLLIKKRYPSLPLYLLGHSMGSLVVRTYCKKYDQDIDGLIICGSPSYNPLAPLGMILSKIIGRIKGDHHRSNIIQSLSFNSFNKNFTIPNSWICSDPEIVNTYNQNPLCNFIFTTNGFYNLFSLMKQTYCKEGWIIKHKNLPIHFIAGEKDPCIQSSKKFNHAVNFIKERGYPHVTSYLFKDMRHEILNETNNHIVYNHILQQLTSWNTNKEL